MEKYMERYNEWLNGPFFDAETKKELEAIREDDNEIRERFTTDLEFGTAGLRGIIGAGTNRMNKYVVRRATQGIADYILSLDAQEAAGGKKPAKTGAERGVVIAYDSRHMSKEFSDEAARCLAANGIRAYRFEDLRPTPELSFSVRELGCIAGINITASHNPSNYNGYKVYWEDGAQITPPHDTGIMERVLSIADFSLCKTVTKEEAEEKGLYITVGKELDDKFISCVEATILNKDLILEMADETTIVYTPLNGTGHVPVMRVMKDLGFKKVYEVPEQAEPNGDFPTTPYPNPEDSKTFTLALKLAKEKDADLVLATDPDADRLGIYVKDAKTGEYIPFTGNMTGALLCEYTLSQKQKRGTLPSDGTVVRTVVSTRLMDAIADAYGCEIVECLTGFKWIAGVIRREEEAGRIRYQFGMEESYGCIIGTYARDKDAVSAVASLCEMASFYKKQGKTLWDAMQDMYRRYGFYREYTKSAAFPGLEGKVQMAALLENLRKQSPAELAGRKVLVVRDYKLDTVTDMKTGRVTKTGLPNSNVILYELEGNAWVCVRPSGTEPKVKFYCGVRGDSFENAAAMVKELDEALTALISG